MSDFYAPEMANPGDGDMFGAFASAVCEHAGHEWADAGGWLEICMVCEANRWAPASPSSRLGGHLGGPVEMRGQGAPGGPRTPEPRPTQDTPEETR